MSCWDYYSNTIDTFVWTESLADHPAVVRVRERLGGARLIEIADPPSGAWEPPADLANPRTLLVQRPSSRAFGRCPGTHGHLCCNYLTIDLYVGCTLGCTYCIMQSYLRNRTLVVQIDDGEAIEHMRSVAANHPGQMVRIGTGEVGDSLLFDPLFDLSRDFIRAAAELDNVRFELKTKTDYVDHLLDIKNPGGAVIAFSVNPPSVVSREEGCAAPLERRLAAAERALAAGFGVAFHFDPMIAVEGWQERYREVVQELARFKGADIAWISLGTLRYPSALGNHFFNTSYVAHEFVRSRDGKMRYIQRERAAMYRMVRSMLEEVFPDTAVYLCMESAAMWRNVYGDAGTDSRRAVRDVLRPVSIRSVVGVER